PDLVEEGQRASLPLERVADEVAEGALALPLGLGREAKRGDRLHVLALVGLEELQGLEAETRPIAWWPRAAVAQDDAEDRDTAEETGGLKNPIALDAAVDLRADAELIGEMHLVPAGDPARGL